VCDSNYFVQRSSKIEVPTASAAPTDAYALLDQSTPVTHAPTPAPAPSSTGPNRQPVKSTARAIAEAVAEQQQSTSGSSSTAVPPPPPPRSGSVASTAEVSGPHSHPPPPPPPGRNRSSRASSGIDGVAASSSTGKEPLSVLLVLYTHGIVVSPSVAAAVVDAVISGTDPRRTSSAADRTGMLPRRSSDNTSVAATERSEPANQEQVFQTLRGLYATTTTHLSVTQVRSSLLLCGRIVHEITLLQERRALQREFHRLVADQRTREGRLLQRWCARELAAGEGICVC
jgi:hypothetical protein